jgi:sugar (pentulose or hexulose) kinase
MQGKTSMLAGVGLHDSSSALIPYLVSFKAPFALISSGTWCITLNPFNSNPLTEYELTQDCLCYLTYAGNPVKASRIFSGNEHEQEVKRLAAHFGCNVNEYQKITLDRGLLKALESLEVKLDVQSTSGLKSSPFAQRDLTDYKDYAEAYHRLVMDLVTVQIESSKLVLDGTPVKRIFVDGGFSRNPIFMYLLAEAFPEYEVFAATVPQATSLGAALAIHNNWNIHKIPSNLIELKYFASQQSLELS